ncbi:MAG TPA: XRE family transcriptional regulator [Mycobacteriales bacterium]|nr:XRE family transcriptional regulator [Mycobacteriales bacterium]
MARTWRQVRGDAVDRGLVDEQRAENAKKVLREAVRSYELADVRRRRDTTQTEMAMRMQVSQARVSKIERGDVTHTEVGTLEAYIGALGGRLQMVADFGDVKVTIR